MALITEGEIEVSETICNLTVVPIQITEDKLKNILTQHIEKIKKSHGWIPALVTVVSFVLTIDTSDFHDSFGFNADTLKGFFGCLILLFFCYFLYVSWNCIKNRDSVDNIIKDIENKQVAKKDNSIKSFFKNSGKRKIDIKA
jgi:protein-S-isoprenylcysteine O-methyltransferase Ste14